MGSRIAVVTGGSAGVGRATVRELARAGYDVAVLARGAEVSTSRKSPVPSTTPHSAW